MKFLPVICILAFLSACSTRQEVTVIECESIVTELDGKFHLRLKPISTEKGKIKNDMLNAEGLLDYQEEHDLDVKFPNTYTVTLIKTTEREGIYRNAPLGLIYNIRINGNYPQRIIHNQQTK